MLQANYIALAQRKPRAEGKFEDLTIDWEFYLRGAAGNRGRATKASMHPFTYELALFLVSLAAAGFGGMLGMAGGIFVVPALVLLFGTGMRHAVGASLVSVIACSSGSAAHFLDHRLTNVRLAILLEVGTTLGALTGVFLSGVFPTPVLYFLFAAILFVSAEQMLRKRRAERAGGPAALKPDRWAEKWGLNSSFPGPGPAEETPYRVARVWLGMVLMYGAGTVSALLGIGSGVLKVPAMDSALRLPIRVSSATSNFMIGVTAAASAGIYFFRGDIVPEIAAPVALGAVCGAFLGSRALMKISGNWIRALFVIVLVGLGVEMLLAAWGVGGLAGAAR